MRKEGREARKERCHFLATRFSPLTSPSLPLTSTDRRAIDGKDDNAPRQRLAPARLPAPGLVLSRAGRQAGGMHLAPPLRQGRGGAALGGDRRLRAAGDLLAHAARGGARAAGDLGGGQPA